MRLCVAFVLLFAAALPVTAQPAHAASVPPAYSRWGDDVVGIGARQYRRQRDCTPTNGPFGFYGNLWCQPANEASYLRNLGASWPMNTPPSLRQPKRSSSTDW
jgi:hypothetical protein